MLASDSFNFLYATEIFTLHLIDTQIICYVSPSSLTSLLPHFQESWR